MKAYRCSRGTSILLGVVGSMFLIMAIYAAFRGETFFTFAGLIFSAMFYFGLFQRLIIVQVDCKVIILSRLGYQKIVAWDEIKSVRSRTFDDSLYFRLKDGQKITIFSQITGFPEILNLAQRMRPDLWSYREGQVFHTVRWFVLALWLLGVLFLWAGIDLLVQDEMLAGLFSFGFGGLTVIWVEQSFYWSITIKRDHLLIRYTFSHKKVAKNQIVRISMNEESKSGQIAHHVILHRVQAKPIHFTLVKEGMIMLYNTLKRWHQSVP